MKTHADHAVLIADLGMWTSLASLLTRDFGKVFYWSPGAECAHPESNPLMVGVGLPGVERVDHIADVLLDYDDRKDELLIVYPDIGCGPEQVYLRKLGWRVWGSGRTEELELYRVVAKKRLATLGLDIGPYEVIKGVEALREYLKRHPGVWVKMSYTRGDWESEYAETYALIKPKIDRLAAKLGERGAIAEFVVEKDIPNAIEIAYDGYSIDGKYPSHSLAGIEVKASAYLGRFLPYAVLPEPLRITNAKIADELANYECRSWFGMEQRVTKDGTAYIVDPLARLGSPPGELVQLMYSNLAEIFWGGAAGEMVEPVCCDDGQWGAEIILRSTWLEQGNWQPVDYPDAIAPYVKLRNECILRGQRYVLPTVSVGTPVVGAVVAAGKTKEDAIEKATKRAGQVKGVSIEFATDALGKATDEARKLKSFGYGIG